MIQLFAPFALLASPFAQQAEAPQSVQLQSVQPPLGLEHRMLARCSAAFALISHGQESGNADALAYPDLRERGSEFFVQAGARLMDEARLDRAQLAQVFSTEAQALIDSDTLDEVVPACLPLLPHD